MAALLGGGLLTAPPARAIEEVVIEFPVLELDVTLRVAELEDPALLRRGTSDLAELDRASGGILGPRLVEVFSQPVPVAVTRIAEGSVGSPLFEQAMLVLSSLGTVEGRPPDLSGEVLRQALEKASAGGEPTLLSLIKAIPGDRVRLDLGRLREVSQRMLAQRRRSEELIAAVAPAPVAPAADQSAGPAPIRQEISLTVPHRPQPLDVLLLRPSQGGNGRLVLVSHGLWDRPASFEGWGRRLAAAGYTVALPRHPGSDQEQQQQVLSGKLPPPSPEELVLRPKDLSAVIDAAADGRLQVSGLDTRQVVVIGHSWGATTTLQLAGLAPSDIELRQRCANLEDPERNLSWTLQCSWLQAADLAGISDRRVIAAVAVSPPLALLFPRGSGSQLHSRVLLVSGTRDWVVPPDPEAVQPASLGATRHGHRLVLARGGDHFNLRPGDGPQGGVLGSLMLAWTDGAFAAGERARPAEGALNLLTRADWGNAQIALTDVSERLQAP
ncbi:alpha/beta fold hydrolase [Cyanobium sp. CH-040]|uniref:alpha/beta fold hydrolase n=1 Tax=Cyanobium sp. CH-040 TaxID=2823708 RepID=UPI0020CC33BB|nr:alpha/beta fold hydrolase [Cyanobium sp. CH-040]